MKTGLPILLTLVVAALVLLGLGRWDGLVSARDAQVIREAKAALRVGKAYRARLQVLKDSAQAQRARETALRVLAARQAHYLDSLREVEARQGYAGATGPVDSVAGELGLVPVKPDLWGADSLTVRHLARLAWRSEVRLPAAESLAVTLDSLWRANVALVETYATRATLAEARVTVLETHLERVLRVAECRILWLVPCPSRTVSFVLGLGVGAVGGYVATR